MKQPTPRYKVDKIMEDMKNDLILIGCWFEQSKGFPPELYTEKVNSMTIADQMLFLCNFSNRYKKFSEKNLRTWKIPQNLSLYTQ